MASRSNLANVDSMNLKSTENSESEDILVYREVSKVRQERTQTDLFLKKTASDQLFSYGNVIQVSWDQSKRLQIRKSRLRKEPF
jgi:hypothetical protein